MFASLKAVAVAVALVAVAPATAATSVHLSSLGLYTPGTVNVTGVPGTSRVYASVIKMGASTGGGTFDLLGFCVDFYHSISAGIGGQNAASLDYARAPFLTDANGGQLSHAQASQIGGLADLGFTVARGNDPDKAVRLAAIQQAIWTIEYPTLNFTAGDTLAGQQAFADTYVAQAASFKGPARVIYSSNNATQGFVVAGVPEPGTWAMLVLGFAAVGVAARRRVGLQRVVA